MKKILVISNMYPSKKYPFYGTFVENFIMDLKNYVPDDRVDMCTIKGRSYDLLTRIRKYLVFYLSIISKLLFYNYDLVYVHIITHAALPLRFISFFKRIPLVFNIHGEDLITQTQLSCYFLKKAIPLLEKSQLIVVPSYFFKNKVQELLPMIPTSKIFVSASGGVKEFFYTNNEKQNNKCLKIGYVSRIDRGKGWDTFIKACKLIKDAGIQFEAIIAGRGLQIEEMNNLVSQLDLQNVSFIGPVEYKELPKVYNKLDLFVFPTKLEESLGLVGLEAMACHTPVIGSHIGGLTDYIEDGINGYFFEIDNEHSLAEKISAYYHSSEEEKINMQNNAYKKALCYKSDVVANELFNKLGL